ncbi:MAG: LytTR family transcriptional regulator DNA-binding domain-containing protein [Clostridia bacterium]|nr:LytTR family transcriptional regulator DNA-binding domain-containing protein [Clostridia bacterium]
MRIAICDDERYESEVLKKAIDDYAVEKNYDIEVCTFESSKEMFKEGKFDLYCLDYSLTDETGIDICLKLKEMYDYSVTVAFYTKYHGYATLFINTVSPDYFISKPLVLSEVHEFVEKFYKASDKSLKRIVLKRNKSYETIYPKDIVLIEASGKNSIIYFTDHVETYPYLISDLEKDHLSPELFVRTDRSYIVNMKYIKSFDSKTINMNDGSKARLSRNDTFRDAYTDFMNRVIF